MESNGPKQNKTFFTSMLTSTLGKIYYCDKSTWQKRRKRMEKEEILEKAQAENKGKDIADLDAQRKGAHLAYFVGLFLIILWDIVEGIVYHQINYGGNMALFAMAFAAFLV